MRLVIPRLHARRTARHAEPPEGLWGNPPCEQQVEDCTNKVAALTTDCLLEPRVARRRPTLELYGNKIFGARNYAGSFDLKSSDLSGCHGWVL